MKKAHFVTVSVPSCKKVSFVTVTAHAVFVVVFDFFHFYFCFYSVLIFTSLWLGHIVLSFRLVALFFLFVQSNLSVFSFGRIVLSFSFVRSFCFVSFVLIHLPCHYPIRSPYQSKIKGYPPLLCCNPSVPILNISSKYFQSYPL